VGHASIGGKLLVMKAHRRVGKRPFKRISPTPNYSPENSIDEFAQKEQELKIEFRGIDGDEIARLVAEKRREQESGLLVDWDSLKDKLRDRCKPRHNYSLGKRMSK
jgi:hypothetical protein